MTNTQTMKMNADDQQHLLEWWNATSAGKAIVQQLTSLVSELRIHPESSHADGMVLFYRAVSEISYGYAGMRGCIRRAFTNEYSGALRENMARCHSFAEKYSVDAKVLLERVAKQISGANAQQLVNLIRNELIKNDEMLKEIFNKTQAFFGKENFQSVQKKIKHSNSLPE